MSEPTRRELTSVAISQGVTDARVDAALADIWSSIRSDPGLRQAAIEAGFTPAALDALPASPLRAEPDAGRIFVAETIMISVASGLATEAVKRLWDRVIWPRLEGRFGAGIAAGAPHGDAR